MYQTELHLPMSQTKIAILLGILFVCLGAHAQTPSVYQNIVFSRVGQPLAGASVAICTQDPGVTPIPCTHLATTYSDITLGSQCLGTGAITYGTGCSNPGITDGFGNYIIYADAGQILWAQISGPRITTYVVPFVMPGGSGSGGSGTVGPGTLNQIAKFTSTTNVGNAICSDDGITPMACTAGLNIATNAQYATKTNNVSTGTTVNLLVARDASGNAINAQTTDANNVLGVAGFNAGTSGSLTYAWAGNFPLKFDNQTAIGDYVTLGATSEGHDAGATQPAGRNYGRITSVNAGAGTNANVDLDMSANGGTSSGGSGIVSFCGTAFAIDYQPVTGTTTQCDPLFLTDGAGNFQAKSGTFTGTVAGFTAYGGGTAPPFCPTGAPACIPANSVGTTGPASVATPYVIRWPNAEGAAGTIMYTDTDSSHVMQMKWIDATSLLKHPCMIVIGAENGSALADADIGPQKEQCQIPFAATVYEVDVTADAGTPSAIVAIRHCTADPCASHFTVTNLVSTALLTAASGGPACSKTGATTGLDGFTTCSATLQNTTIAQGDYIETVSGTAGGTAKRLSIAVHFTQ
jgi:hypothetical protein